MHSADASHTTVPALCRSDAANPITRDQLREIKDIAAPGIRRPLEVQARLQNSAGVPLRAVHNAVSGTCKKTKPRQPFCHLPGKLM